MRSIRSFANDDRHVMAKHSTIYPSPEELEAVQNMVSTVECALKHVSDWMDERSKSSTGENDVQNKSEEKEESSTDESGRVLCGVMRIGLVAKGLLIKEDMELELVLLCKEKPTESLLVTVRENLPLQIQKLTEESYEVEHSLEDSSLIIHNAKEPKLTLKVILTSPLFREEEERAGGASQACPYKLAKQHWTYVRPLTNRPHSVMSTEAASPPGQDGLPVAPPIFLAPPSTFCPSHKHQLYSVKCWSVRDVSGTIWEESETIEDLNCIHSLMLQWNVMMVQTLLGECRYYTKTYLFVPEHHCLHYKT